jgi:hypothetical protein
MNKQHSKFISENNKQRERKARNIVNPAIGSLNIDVPTEGMNYLLSKQHFNELMQKP